VEAIKYVYEVDSSNDGKHEDQNGVKDNEIDEVSKHLLYNLHQRTDLRVELDKLNDSPKQTADDDRIHVLELEVDVVRDIVNLPVNILLVSHSWHIDAFDYVGSSPLDVEQ
jgi:hypothetical protein